MRGENVHVAGACGGLREQPIARVACRFLQPRPRLSALLAQRAVRNAEAARQALHRRGLARRFGAQTVIDGDRD